MGGVSLGTPQSDYVICAQTLNNLNLKRPPPSEG